MRSVPLDVARGLAIVGVVYNHTVDGLIGAALVDEASPIAQVNEALYVLRMPALVFLVGLFIPSGVSKRGVGGYVRGRVALLVYLYVLWQLLQGLAELATGSVRNGSTTPGDVLALWYPLAHLWFLPFLALATALVAPWIASRRRVVVIAGAVLLSAVTLAAWAAPLDLAGLRGIALVGFLAAGAAVGLRRMIAQLQRPLWQWSALGVAAVGAFLALLLLGPRPATLPAASDPVANLVSVAAAAMGVVALLSLAVLLARVPLIGRLLAVIGTVTLPIYLAHIMVVAGGRIALNAVGVDDPGILLLVIVPLGVALPVLLDRIAGPLHLGWLFALPRPFARLLRLEPRRPLAPARPAASTGVASRTTRLTNRLPE